MNTIVNENFISFKEFEQKMFQYVCELGCELTKTMLERYDEELTEERDKKSYHNKGLRSTTIKTVYGEVSYFRRVYETKQEDGRSGYIYLLDQALSIEKIGMISTN